MDIIGVTTIMGRPGIPSEELRYILRLQYTVLISEAHDKDSDVICYDLNTAFEKYTPSTKEKAYLLTDFHETE